MSERDRIEQALTFDTGCEPSAQEIIDALNRAGYQITPQAEPVAWRSVDNTGDYIYSASDTIGGEPLYTAPPRPAYVGVDLASGPDVTAIQHKDGSVEYRTAPPPPVCPHIRSSDEGTQWCDLAVSVGDLSPVAPVWQPIETAPRDEPFVGYFGNGEIHIVEIDSEKNECFRPMGEERWAMPTHWQPLPSPPDRPGEEEL